MTLEETYFAIHPCKHGLDGRSDVCSECVVETMRNLVNDEREACAKIADEIDDSVAEAIAERIRARGQQ